MTALRFAVPGPVAATRSRAKEIRTQLSHLIANAQSRDTITVDLSAIEAMTVSFADELFGGLLEDRAEGNWLDRRVFVSGLSNEVRESAEAALERRRLMIVATDNSNHQALAAPDWFAATLGLAEELGVFRAIEIAQRLHITPQAANNRLQRMTISGALARELRVPSGGGKEFEYRAI